MSPESVENTDGPAVADRARAEETQPAAAAELEQRVAALERQVASERDAATDYMQRWQRAQADFANFRRRAQQEQEQRDALVTARALAAVLPALDSFQRAFATLPDSLRGFGWIDGIALVELQLRRGLDALEVRAVEVAPGQPFDPLRHESIGEMETEAHPAGHVAAVIQPGYELRGFVLRPALVQLARERASAVTRAPADASAAQDEHGASADTPEAPGAEGTTS
jgi:molecular chaperone GrpE